MKFGTILYFKHNEHSMPVISFDTQYVDVS